MKSWLPFAILSAGLLAVAAVLYVVFPPNETPPTPAAPKVHLSLVTTATFEQEVLKNPKPVLVDFTAEWCTWCRKMEPALSSLAADFEVRQIDFDANRALAKRYRVDGLPTLLIFMNGDVVNRHEGFTSESTLRSELKQLSKR